MKNLKFYLIIIALAVGLTWALVAYFKAKSEVTAYKNSKQRVEKEILTQAKEVSRSVNEKGIESVIFDVTNNHTSNKNVQNTDMKDIVDTAALALDIQSKKLKEVTVIAAQYKAENLQLKTQLDSNRQTYYTYNQNGLKLKFTPPYDTVRYAKADFLGTLSLTAAQGYKRKWFLGKEKTLLSITSDSPFFSIDEVNYIGFDKEPPRVRLEARATSSFNSVTGLGLGSGLFIKIGGLNLEGNYQYYNQQRRWMYGANASFNLLGF